MKQYTIVGNWKSNKTIQETQSWVDEIAQYSTDLDKRAEVADIVICAPFTALSTISRAVLDKKLPISIGAQDVSQFEDGAYTGAVSVTMVKELASYVIIGHSERRKYFAESDDVLLKKTEAAKSAGVTVIYCVPDDQTQVPDSVDIVAYEPVWAIGTGKTDTPQNANSTIERIKANTGINRAIYGGSVKPDNVQSFISQPSIDGVLPGGASLKAETFASLVQNISDSSS